MLNKKRRAEQKVMYAEAKESAETEMKKKKVALNRETRKWCRNRKERKRVE